MSDSTGVKTILILAAIPHGLRLDREIRSIEEAIRRATKRNLFKVTLRTAVRPQDIRRALAEEKPQIVHFCGHGLEDGSLLLEDDAEENKPVPAEGLASLFQLHANYVECVLLNACHSVKPATAIGEYINYAIGMNQPIGDKAAIAFAIGFYDGLGYATSDNLDVFQRAFEEGKVAVQLEHTSSGQIPVLKTKTKDKPVQLAPSSYQESCENMSVAGDILTAYCRRMDGTYNHTSILIRGICNDNGVLRYDSDPTTNSSYQESCENITIAGDILTAYCRRMDGTYNYTSIAIRGISNDNGVLRYS
ncbi:MULTISPECIES: mannose-binding lectin [Nostocales]|uniref:CHAT domain-containing protein n=3 Tax=Nostocales TaxID=1161 RepID=A0A8S9STK8_9CYAN|nr:CVNH domain-containing protein [Tolypothrix bouteillei]KAF3883840.1 CHAT domain-containing protein [Tolypothrix bouteillei VB521301]